MCVCCLSCCFCRVGCWFLFLGKFDLNHRLIPVVDRPCLALVRQCRKKKIKATKAQEQLEFTGSAKIACAKGLFGETGLVGFCVVWTREELGFISLEGFLLSLGFLDSKGS